MARGGKVYISGDASQLKKELGEADKSLSKFGKSSKSSFGGMAKGAALASGALAGAGGLAFAFKSCVDAAAESEQVTAQTEAVLKSTGNQAGITAKQVGDLASAISAKTGIDDEAIQSSENLLLTFTKVRNEAGKGNDIFNQATMTITDMSVALKQDAKSSAIQLGKALNDPIKGITALSRVGVTFDDQQKKQIKTYVQSGDTLKAQKVILAELNKEFGGSAVAAGNTFQGSMNKAKVALGNLQETVGTAVLPALTKLATKFAGFIGDLQDPNSSVRRFADNLKNTVGPTFEQVKKTIGDFAGSVRGYFRDNKQTIDDLGRAFTKIGIVVKAVFEGFVLPVIKRVIPGIVQQLRGLVQVVTGIFKVFSAVINGEWGKAWDGVKQIVKGVLTNIVGALRVATAPIRQALSMIGGMLKSYVTDQWQKAKNTVSDIMNGIKRTVNGAVGGVKSAASNVANGVINGFKNIDKLPGKIWDTMKDVNASIGRAAGGAASAAGRVVSSIGSAFGRLGSVVGGAIKSAFSGAGGWAADIGNAIRRWINDHTIFGDKIKIGPKSFSIPSLSTGARIGGPNGAGDIIPAMLKPGEVVLNEVQQAMIGSDRIDSVLNATGAPSVGMFFSGGKTRSKKKTSKPVKQTNKNASMVEKKLAVGSNAYAYSAAQSDVDLASAELTDANTEDDIKAIDKTSGGIGKRIAAINTLLSRGYVVVKKGKKSTKIKLSMAQKTSLYSELASLKGQQKSLADRKYAITNPTTTTDDTTIGGDSVIDTGSGSDTTTSVDPDFGAREAAYQANLDAANSRAALAQAVQTKANKINAAFNSVTGGLGDIGAGGINVFTVPTDPKLALATANHVVAGLGFQGSVGSSTIRTGI